MCVFFVDCKVNLNNFMVSALKCGDEGSLMLAPSEMYWIFI